MSVEMEKRARVILRDALLKHYIDELVDTRSRRGSKRMVVGFQTIR